MASYLRQNLQYFTSSNSEDVKEEALNSVNRQKIERSKIGITRPLLQAQDPSAKDLDDLMIRRFLRARDLDVEKGSAMLLKYLKWRKEIVPNGFILTPSEIPNDLAHNKLLMQGFDKTGRPTAVVFAARHRPTTVEEFTCLMTAWKTVYPFIDKNTKQKIIFVEDKKLQSTLWRKAKAGSRSTLLTIYI